MNKINERMKTIRFWKTTLLFVAMVGVLGSCDDDDEGKGLKWQSYSNGAYVVNAGNMYSNIDGSLTAIDYATSTAQQKVFAEANQRSLGSTPNDGLVYGSKIYIAVDQSNTIEVIDRTTLRSVAQINTTELMGVAEGKEPRHIIGNDGYVFFTTYGGYVAQVDTMQFRLKQKFKVGNYPEGLLAMGTQIIVANSNYAQGGGNLSVIDTQKGTTDTYTIEGINNPQKLFAVSGNLIVLDWVYYDGSNNEMGESALKLVSLPNRTAQTMVEATYAALTNDGVFYTVANPYTNPTYGVYDTQKNGFAGNSSAQPAFAISEIPESPAGIEVDPVTGHVFILSYHMGDYGYADYNADGYVLEFDQTGQRLHSYKTGVGPTMMFFDAGTRIVAVP